MTVSMPQAVRSADSHILYLVREELRDTGDAAGLRARLRAPIPPATTVELADLDEAAQEARVKANLGLHLRQYMAGTGDSLSPEEAAFLAGLFGFAVGRGDDRFPIGARVSFPFTDEARERELKGFVIDTRDRDPILLMVDDDGAVGAVQVAAQAVAVTAGPHVLGASAPGEHRG